MLRRDNPTQKKLFIDAMPIASERMSGVGYAVHGYILGLASDDEFRRSYRIILVATAKSMKYIKKLNIPNVEYQAVPLPYRVWNRMPGLRFLPPIDLILGKGVYLFTNFRRWPLLFSPSATLIYDMSFFAYPEFAAQRNRDFLTKNIQRWAKQSSQVITISQFSKDEIVRTLGITESRVDVVYLGVNPKEYYRRSEDEIAAIRAKYKLPKDYIIYVGNIEPRKNISNLIRAYTGLSRPLKDLHPLILISGGGWLDNEIASDIAKAQSNGDNIIRPEIYITDIDLPAVFSGAALLAHPSYYEGFGVSLVQAMATGVPVLTSDNSSMREVAEQAALLVDPTDIKAITSALEQILSDPALRAKLIRAGYERAEMFTWDRATKELSATIGRL